MPTGNIMKRNSGSFLRRRRPHRHLCPRLLQCHRFNKLIYKKVKTKQAVSNNRDSLFQFNNVI